MPALRRAIVITALVLAAGLCHAQNAPANDGYPSRPIRLVAPFAPGGPVDVVARLLAPKLTESLGTQVYVENVPGGSGNIGTAMVAKAPADGYTILIISSSLVVNPSLIAKLSFDTGKDLAPVSLIGNAPQVILVNPAVPANTMKEFVALVKANPGKYSYGSAGLGTPGFLAGEMLKQTFGIDLVHVPFQGGGPAVMSTVGGHTPAVITTISSAAGQVQQGTLRPLAVTSGARSPALPDVPTLAEAGVPDQESEIFVGALVPVGTPKAIVERLHGDLIKIVADPKTKELMAAAGFDAVGSTPEVFATRIKAEIVKWAKVIRDANIKTQ